MSWQIDCMTDWLFVCFFCTERNFVLSSFCFCKLVNYHFHYHYHFFFSVKMFFISCSFLGESIFDPMTRKEIRGIQRKLCKIKVIVRTKLHRSTFTSDIFFQGHSQPESFNYCSFCFPEKLWPDYQNQCSRMHWLSHLDRVARGLVSHVRSVYKEKSFFPARKVTLPSQEGDRASEAGPFLPKPTFKRFS